MTEQRRAERWWTDVEQDGIHLEAAEWLTRLQNPGVSLEDTLAWQLWMTADPRHAEAFARMEETCRVLRAVPRAALPNSYPASRRAVGQRRRRMLALAASIVASTGVISWLAMNQDLPVHAGLRETLLVETAVGENRSIDLPDGSHVVLGGSTSLDVVLGQRTRELRLARGEAFFKVAKDPSRPFKVRAGAAEVTAVGTEFNVRRADDRVVIAVVEGRVRVEPTSSILPVSLLSRIKPELTPVHVAAGEQTTIAHAAIGTAVQLPDPSVAMAWQHGRLAFQSEPLRYVLEDVNRYAPKPITAEDESIGELRISGTVMADNVRGWIASLENAFGLQAVEERERVVLRRRKESLRGDR